MILRLLSGLTAIALLSSCGPAGAADTAVIFMYHHVADDTPASTSVAPALFRKQMQYLADERFNVLPLLEVIESLRAERSLPERTVVLTFDDGYESVLSEAAPLLERHGWPFTVFVTPGYIDGGYSAFLGWDELRELAARGATIGNHTLDHEHLVRRNGSESEAAWADRIREQIAGAGARIEAEVGAAAVPVLAYPYGEHDARVTAVVDGLGLTGVGQQSGAIGTGSDWLALPRYAISGSLDSLGDFSVRALSRPLYLDVTEGRAALNDAPDGRPVLAARVSSPDVSIGQLACYASGQGRLDVEWTDPGKRRFRVQPDRPLPPGRSRINCTAPASDDPGVYHWFGKIWLTLMPDGSWYSE